MELVVVSSIIAAASGIMGGGLVSFVQLRSARESQSAQYRLESLKLSVAADESRKITLVNTYTEVHKILSRTVREYSMTSLDIMWRAGGHEADFDKKYLMACESFDAARAVVDIYFPEASGLMEEIYGEMNIFWGNVKEIIALTRAGEPYTKKEKFHSDSIAASINISEYVLQVKRRLNSLVAGAST